MCIGAPMQVVESGPDWAWCEADGQRERLDMVLIGPQPVGTWVLAVGFAPSPVGAAFHHLHGNADAHQPASPPWTWLRKRASPTRQAWSALGRPSS